MKKQDKNKIKRKIRRDEALEFSKEANLKELVFKNIRLYTRKEKHKRNFSKNKIN
tara:strand:+ start:55 stop:219 length:165 start_codon:yes stop_codon:yes gene_type:complete